jgi:hypothetical protein
VEYKIGTLLVSLDAIAPLFVMTVSSCLVPWINHPLDVLGSLCLSQVELPRTKICGDFMLEGALPCQKCSPVGSLGLGEIKTKDFNTSGFLGQNSKS